MTTMTPIISLHGWIEDYVHHSIYIYPLIASLVPHERNLCARVVWMRIWFVVTHLYFRVCGSLVRSYSLLFCYIWLTKRSCIKAGKHLPKSLVIISDRVLERAHISMYEYRGAMLLLMYIGNKYVYDRGGLGWWGIYTWIFSDWLTGEWDRIIFASGKCAVLSDDYTSMGMCLDVCIEFIASVYFILQFKSL